MADWTCKFKVFIVQNQAKDKKQLHGRREKFGYKFSKEGNLSGYHY
jgi:hypothetical protein